MRVFTQALRKRGVIITATVLMVCAAVGGLILSTAPWEDTMRPQQAKARIASFVDDTLAHVVPGSTPVPGPADGSTGVCLNRVGGTADANDLVYDREVTDFDPALGDEILKRAEQYWREQGLEIYRDDNTPGVSSISSSADGFAYSFVVNRNEPLVSMIAQTPCFSTSEWEEVGTA